MAGEIVAFSNPMHLGIFADELVTPEPTVSTATKFDDSLWPGVPLPAIALVGDKPM